MNEDDAKYYIDGPPACAGLLGKMFGHKFVSADGSVRYEHCVRCGMPEGGWEKGD